MEIPIVEALPTKDKRRGRQVGSFGEAQYDLAGRGCISAARRVSTTLHKRIDDQPSISREMVREAQSILHAHLKRVGLKHTEQRDTILRTFLETREHLSTDELHRLVKRKDPKIGFTTVYRTLKLLAECEIGRAHV